MSYAVRASEHPRHAGGSSATDRPSTAAVRSFICLYTHDLKRKQKRWQDGKIKYHTFNRRIMVYDERGGFVGDAHWQGEQDLEDGEELQLDRGSAIVQVCDFTGEQQQDLTEILDKRAQEVEKRRANAAARMGGSASQQTVRTPAPASRTTNPPNATTTPLPRRPEGVRPQPHFQLLHRPLSAIVPSPGPIGRAAVPEHSPYETRKAEQGQGQGVGPEAPAPKRRRLSASPPSSKSAFATRLFGAKLTLNGSAGASAARQKVLRDATNVHHKVDFEKTSPKDVDNSSRVEDEDDADVVMLDGPPTRAVPQQLSAAKLSGQDQIRQRTKAPVSRLREPQYPTPHTRALIAGHAQENKNNQRTTEEPRQLPLQEHHQGGNRGVRHNPEQADRVIGHPKVPSKPTRPSKSLQRGSVGRLEDVAPSHREPTPEVAMTAEDAAEQSAVEPPRTASRLRTKAADKDADQDDNIPQPPNELRTELRIKPRRKRGLLMVSEKTARASANSVERTTDVEEPRTTRAPPAETRQVTKQPSTPHPLRVPDDSDTEEVPRSPPSLVSNSHKELSEHATSATARGSIEDDTPVLETDSEKPSDEDSTSPVACKSTNATKFVPGTKDSSQAHQPVVETLELSMTEDEDEDEVVPHARRARGAKKSARKELSEEMSELGASADSADETHTIEGSEDDPAESRPGGATRSQMNGQEMDLGQPGPGKRTKRKPLSPFVDDDSSEEEPPRTLRTRQLEKRKHSAVGEDDSSESFQGPKRPTRRATLRRKTHDVEFPFSDDDLDDVDDNFEQAAPVQAKAKSQKEDLKETGPRIARMARKSVKSKEIFGFVLPNSNFVPTTMAAAFGRVGPVIQSEPVAAAENFPEQAKPVKEQSQPSVGATTMAGGAAGVTTARIANPATRGKKAARKEDAAGLAPQVLPPSDPAPTLAAVRRPVAVEKPTTNTMAFPGFSKASGGTWSKHAEDLLGMKRPVGRR